MLKKVLYTTVLLVSCLEIDAQIDSKWNQKPQVNITGFVDAYYVYDFNKPTGNRQDFFFNHNRHNEFNINNAVAIIALDHQKYRMNLGLHC